MFFPSEEDILAIISAEKTGYNKIKDYEVNLISKNAKISLEPASEPDPYSNNTIVELIDSESGEKIIDNTEVAMVSFKCSNKNISEKNVKEDDGTLDGEFTLNENNCGFIVTGASAPGYEQLSGSIELSSTRNTISLKPFSSGKGTSMVWVSEKNSFPKKWLPGIQITFIDSTGGTVGTTRTDNGGVASTQLVPGIYGLIASSLDGNYATINIDENISIVITAGNTTNLELEMIKVNASLIRFIKIKVLESSDNNTPVSGVRVYLQSVISDVNGSYVDGVAGEYKNCFPNSDCLTDSNGLLGISGLNALDAEKRVLTLYKEGYVYKFVKPIFFKIN
jgi:hypothetical protein